jgi:hypothetical protein
MAQTTVSNNVRIVFERLIKDPMLVKELNVVLAKIFELSPARLTREEKIDIVHILADSLDSGPL